MVRRERAGGSRVVEGIAPGATSGAGVPGVEPPPPPPPPLVGAGVEHATD